MDAVGGVWSRFANRQHNIICTLNRTALAWPLTILEFDFVLHLQVTACLCCLMKLTRHLPPTIRKPISFLFPNPTLIFRPF